MEQNSLEICEADCQRGTKIDGVSKRFCDIESPKIVRHPLQAFNSPVLVTPKVQPSVKITPYRYHACKVIPEEVENQENIDPKTLYSTDSGNATQKSGDSIKVDMSPNISSPFTYPLILEGCHLSSSSSSSSYKSTLGQSSHHHEVSSCSYDSPKSTFTTPRGMSVIMGNSDRSHSSRAGSELEGFEMLHGKLICNSSHRIANTGWTLTRGIISSNSSLSSSTVSSHKNVVTPSKSSSASGLSDRSLFQTPSDSYGSSSSDNRLTPQQRCKGYPQIWNPFDAGVDHLHLPTVSPSLFRQVVSPGDKDYKNFQWSIDELALLKPANIETSPYNQSDIVTDPEYEFKAQDAIDKFFSGQPVVPSPWTGNNKSISVVPMNLASENAVSSKPLPSTRTISCQTELSLPMVLPESVEATLKPYITYNQDQGFQSNTEFEEGSNLNNTTLRRKLLFSSDDLVNATPMCSPHGGTSPESSVSSSPAAPLPLHDDDVISEFDTEDTEGLVWYTEVVKPSFSNLMDISQKRCSPTTPPCDEQLASQNIGPTFGLSKKHDIFCSPNYESEPMPSLDLSPIEDKAHTTTPQFNSIVSPNVSPIQLNTNCENAEHSLFASTCGLDVAPSEKRISTSVPPNISILHFSNLSNRNCEMQTNNFERNDKSSFSEHNHEESNLADVDMVCNISRKNNYISEDKNSISSNPSHNTFGLVSPKNKSSVLKSSPVPVSKVLPGERMWVEAMHAESGHEGTKESVLCLKNDSEEKTNETRENISAVQPKSPSSKSETRASGNSVHFSSSPIRDCKTFSYSPPLSPILNRSISVHNQGEQVKSQPQSQCRLDTPLTRGNLSQSTDLSVDMEVRNATDEEIALDEGVSSIETAKHNNPLSNNKHFADIHEFSSVCNMDTDFQQSFEISACHETKSQESGYQTGSMQSTNFSMNTFTNSAICSSMSFLKDRHPSIFGNDGSNLYVVTKVNDRKILNQSNTHNDAK